MNSHRSQNLARVAQRGDADERAAANEQRFRLAAIVESSDDAIIGKTLEGVVTSWNEGAHRLFGYSATEMLGQPVSRLVPGDRLGEEAPILAKLARPTSFQGRGSDSQRCNGSSTDMGAAYGPWAP